MQLHNTVRIAAIENYTDKVVDINGDRTPDLSHGEVWEIFVRQGLPNLQIDRFELSRAHEFEPQELQAHLQNIRQQHTPYDVVSLTSLIHMPIQTQVCNGLPMTADTLMRWRQGLKQKLAQSTPRDQAALGIIKTLERLQQKGQKVYVSAGNMGRKHFNILSLAKGPQHVAATDAQDKISDYSAANSLINRQAQGTYAVTKVDGGYDLTGDGKADVLDQQVSKGKPIVEGYIGKRLEEVGMTNGEFHEIQRVLQAGESGERLTALNTRLLPLEIAAQFGWVTPEAFVYHKTHGDYALMRATRGGISVDHVFQVENGRIVYDPDGSGRKNAVNALHGTSWAQPAAINQDLKQQRS